MLHGNVKTFDVISKRKGKKAERLSWRWRVIIWFIFICAVQGKGFNYSKIIIFIFFDTIATLLTLDSVISWSLIMR